MLRGHSCKVFDILGYFLTYLPTYIRFSPLWTNFSLILVEANVEPDSNGFYHIGDMILSPGQYQRAYGNSLVESDDPILDSGLRDEEYRWKDGSKLTFSF